MMDIKNRKKSILTYVLPAVGAMFVSYFYVVVDGMFVGQGVGASALASVNIAIPFTEILLALASMITLGGASITAIRMGRGERGKANESFVASFVLIIVSSLIVTALGVLFPHEIARLFGATNALAEGTAAYIRWYSAFAIFLTLSVLLAVFVRNDGNPKLAFWGMIAGAGANIFLDWLFIFPMNMGIAGAAIASGLGQLVSALILASHFIKKRGTLRIKKYKPNLLLWGKVAKRGAPEFIVQMSMPITIFCYNQVVLHYLGEAGLSAFSIISYILTMMLGIFFGVSQGIQPLIGRSFGEKEPEGVKYYFRSGIVINVVLSAAIYLLLVLFGNGLISMFTQDEAIAKMAYGILWVYGFSFVPAAINIIFTTYFLSTKNTLKAVAVSAARGMVLNTLFIFLIPILVGESFIWYAMLIVEGLTVLIAIALKLYKGRRRERINSKVAYVKND